jgi:Short C-terminal domain
MRDTTRGFAIVAAVVLVLLFGLALLYAYRSQSPAIPTVPMTALLAQVQQGRVASVVIEDGRATATLIDHSQQRASVPGNGEDLARAIEEHNRADPAHPVVLHDDSAMPPGIFVLFPVLLTVLLPVLVILALIQFAASAFARARVPQPYEALGRLADLRDRGVLTEEEFQREKRRLLK